MEGHAGDLPVLQNHPASELIAPPMGVEMDGIMDSCKEGISMASRNKKLLGAPGLTSSNRFAIRNKCIATSNKCSQLGAPSGLGPWQASEGYRLHEVLTEHHAIDRTGISNYL